MAYNDLREWITALEKAGELKRIRSEVDPVLEVAEITDRVSKGAAKKYGRPGGPALLFENVKGANGVPLLINPCVALCLSAEQIPGGPPTITSSQTRVVAT